MLVQISYLGVAIPDVMVLLECGSSSQDSMAQYADIEQGLFIAV